MTTEELQKQKRMGVTMAFGKLPIPGAVCGATMKRGHCATHGDFHSLALPGRDPRCPKCLEKNVDAEFARKVLQRHGGLATYWNVGTRQGVPPPRFTDSSFENYRVDTGAQKDVLDLLLNYRDRFGPGFKGMIMKGSPGTGKTHLGISLVKDLSQRGYRCAYITLFDFIAQCSRSETDRSPVIETLNSYDLVVLDEVGAHGDFGFTQELVLSKIFQLIDARYSNNRTTVIITNASKDEFERAGLGTRVIDRMKGAVMATFAWESARG